MCFSKTVENLILVNYSDIIGEHMDDRMEEI